ncbi:thermonuclease family protein [Hymenobacter sp. BRD128]|nr:thermonuclease family protein [Hymenobacter sp. BRD128]QKG58791.1 thermonuclease family protein [Hymenobacter sp. BRD128]
MVALGLAPGSCGRRVDRALLAPAGPPPLLRTLALTGPAWELGRVVRVLDGDTYEVLTGGQVVRVRLLGVDAPEASQPFGHQATNSVRAYLSGRLVRLQRQGVDLYGRTLGVLRVPVASPWPAPAAVALDSVLVVRGWAWAFDPSHVVAARASQQTEAQRTGRGLWKCGTEAPVPPKLWRSFNSAIKRRYLGGCTW